MKSQKGKSNFKVHDPLKLENIFSSLHFMLCLLVLRLCGTRHLARLGYAYMNSTQLKLALLVVRTRFYRFSFYGTGVLHNCLKSR